MSADMEALFSRITGATKLDAEMRAALRQRLGQLPPDRALAATEIIENVRDKSLALRKLAEERREERLRNEAEQAIGNQQPDFEGILLSAREMIEGVMETVGKSLAGLALSPYLAAPIVRAGIDKWALNHLISKEEETHSAEFVHLKKHLSPSPHSWRNMEPPLPGNFVIDKTLQTLTCLDALTRLEVYCRSTGIPENIVGINSGGSIVAQYLARRLGLSTAHVHQINTNKNNVTAVGKISQIKPTNILLVDDIVRSGRTLSMIQNYLMNGGFQAPRFVCVVASLDGKATLGDLPVYSPVLSATSDVKLPWVTRGSLTKKGHSYLFGDPDDGPFAVDDRQVDVIVKEVSISRKLAAD